MSSRVQQPVQRDFMIDYCSLNVEDQNLRGEARWDHPLPWKVMSLVTMATKKKLLKIQKFLLHSKDHEKLIKKKVTTYIWKWIYREIIRKYIRQNDVIKRWCHRKIKQILKFKTFWLFGKNNASEHKYYYEKVW